MLSFVQEISILNAVVTNMLCRIPVSLTLSSLLVVLARFFSEVVFFRLLTKLHAGKLAASVATQLAQVCHVGIFLLLLFVFWQTVELMYKP